VFGWKDVLFMIVKCRVLNFNKMTCYEMHDIDLRILYLSNADAVVCGKLRCLVSDNELILTVNE